MLTSDVLLFVRIAETSSFKEAAQQLRMSRGAASKRLALLERELGATLVYRSSRSIRLTSAGEAVLEHCRKICAISEEAKIAIEALDARPRGRLRFSLPTCLGASVLPILNRPFEMNYPDVVLDAHTSESLVDVVAGGYDVVIRVARKLADSSLTAQRLAVSPLVVAASPAYLGRQGVPQHPHELANHHCLGLGERARGRVVWQFHDCNGPFDVRVKLAATSDTNLALVLAACSGSGLIYVPSAVIGNEIRRNLLTPVLTPYCRSIEWGVYAVYPGRSPTKSASVLVDFLKDSFPRLDDLDRWELRDRYYAPPSRTSSNR